MHFLLDMVDFQCNVGSLPEDIQIEIYQLVDWILCYKQKMVQVLRVWSLGLGASFMSLPPKTKAAKPIVIDTLLVGPIS